MGVFDMTIHQRANDDQFRNTFGVPKLLDTGLKDALDKAEIVSMHHLNFTEPYILEPNCLFERGDSVIVLNYQSVATRPKFLTAAWRAMHSAPRADPNYDCYLKIKKVVRDYRTQNIGFVCE